jgi:hypothetical protein
MQIDYELRQDDFIESFAVHRNRNIVSKWLTRMLMSFVIVVVLILALPLIVRPDAQETKSLLPFFGLVLMWVALLWGHPRWSARRQFLKQPGAHGQRTVLLDDSGVHWRWNGGSSDIAWKNFVRSLEGKRQFLLYTSPACFNIIPKRVLTPEELLELRALLKRNISA